MRSPLGKVKVLYKNFLPVLVGQAGVLADRGGVNFIGHPTSVIIPMNNDAILKIIQISIYPFPVSPPLGFKKDFSHWVPPMISFSLTDSPGRRDGNKSLSMSVIHPQVLLLNPITPLSLILSTYSAFG